MPHSGVHSESSHRGLKVHMTASSPVSLWCYTSRLIFITEITGFVMERALQQRKLSIQYLKSRGGEWKMSALEFPQGKGFQSFVLSGPERSSSSTRRGREERSKNTLNTCVNTVPARLCLGKRYHTFNLSEHIHAVNKACACLRYCHNTC